MPNTEEYNVNFFKPLSDHAKANKKLISTLAIIWFVAVFGFQALLILFNEPTPEKAYTSFTSVWPSVVDNQDAPVQDKQLLSRSVLSVLGKNIAVKDDHKTVLKEVLTWSVMTTLPDSLQSPFMTQPTDETFKSAASIIGLQNEGFDKIMVDLLPFSLVKANSNVVSEASKASLPDIMELYLVHNRSFLTDFNFLGFPFHYWYTVQFLLILFVVLCLIYAVAIEKTNKKFNFVEES